MVLSVQIVLEKPPVGVVFGLQKGSGNVYETILIQTSTVDDMIFDFAIELKGEKGKDEFPDFKGPHVQGPKPERFIYIDIGTYAKHTNSVWGRRLKVPLRNITWEMIDKINTNTILKTIVPGTAKDGSPSCATVKPFDGWKVVTK